MQTYDLSVENRVLSAACEDTTLVRTSRGVDRLRIRFDSDEWAEFGLSCAFSSGGAVAEVPIAPEPDGAGGYVAEVGVPDSALAAGGQLGVCVHGTDAVGNHIITALSRPLEIEMEGDGEGGAPAPNPS